MNELKNTREHLKILKNIMPENKYRDDNILVKWSKGLSGESPIDENVNGKCNECQRSIFMYIIKKKKLLKMYAFSNDIVCSLTDMKNSARTWYI